MLSDRLQELEAEGILERTVIPDTPVRVEYALTKKGHALAWRSTPSPTGRTSGPRPRPVPRAVDADQSAIDGDDAEPDVVGAPFRLVAEA